MTALASGDVTVSLAARNIQITAGTKLVSLPTISFGDGSLTYPTGGVPLPAIGQFGLKRQVDRLIIQQPYGDGFVYKYDSADHKIKIFTQGATTGSTAAASNENGALVEDSLAAEGTVRLPNTAPDTTYDMGGLIEMPNGSAIPAVTLPLFLIGE